MQRVGNHNRQQQGDNDLNGKHLLHQCNTKTNPFFVRLLTRVCKGILSSLSLPYLCCSIRFLPLRLASYNATSARLSN